MTSANYVRPSRWATIKPKTRIVVWMKVPNPRVSDYSFGGEMVGWEKGKFGETLRVRTIGNQETLTPKQDITFIHSFGIN